MSCLVAFRYFLKVATSQADCQVTAVGYTSVCDPQLCLLPLSFVQAVLSIIFVFTAVEVTNCDKLNHLVAYFRGHLVKEKDAF